MTIRSGEEAFETIVPIMQRYGAAGSPAGFFEAVNRVFHDVEAHVYDNIHEDMWEGLPAIFDLLVEDAGRSGAQFPARITLLDIGCGTGLATEMFRCTSAGARLAEVCMLDTSATMLEKAKERARNWPEIELRTRLGTLFDVPDEETYDVVLASSVLHHIPDLPAFFRQLEPRLRPGGLFVHFQDGNEEAEASPVLERRRERAQALILSQSPSGSGVQGGLRDAVKTALRSVGLLDLARQASGDLSASLLRRFGVGRVRPRDYLFHVNRALLSEGFIRRSMSAEDIWHVTDIHVGQGLGLSISEMRRFLPGLECLSVRTYRFFGVDVLPPSLLAEEKELAASGDLDGSLLAAVWQKRNS
jgi:SAM-dependent methyltransferase